MPIPTRRPTVLDHSLFPPPDQLSALSVTSLLSLHVPIFIMASQEAQSKAQALNIKLESAARAVIDDIEKNHLRKVAKDAFKCAVACYDKAGTTGPSEALEHCVQHCQLPHRQKQQYVQQVRVDGEMTSYDRRGRPFFDISHFFSDYGIVKTRKSASFRAV